MKFQVKHDIRGRLRVHIPQKRMSFAEADTLLYYLEGLPFVTQAKVYEKTCDAVIRYNGERREVLLALKQFDYAEVELPAAFSAHLPSKI